MKSVATENYYQNSTPNQRIMKKCPAKFQNFHGPVTLVDPGSIPGLGRFTGEEIGYPPQYSWASLVAQLVKNWPAVWETWVQSLCWEDSLEKGKFTHPSILAWRIPWTIQSMGSQRV